MKFEQIRVGGVVGLLGAAVILVSVFLPLAESHQFFRVADNSLIQHAETGWLIVVLALATAVLSFGAMQGEKGWWLIGAGAAAILLAVLFGESDSLLTLESAAGSFFERQTERASPGAGIYALGVGGALAVLGGLMTNGSEDVAETRPER